MLTENEIIKFVEQVGINCDLLIRPYIGHISKPVDILIVGFNAASSIKFSKLDEEHSRNIKSFFKDDKGIAKYHKRSRTRERLRTLVDVLQEHNVGNILQSNLHWWPTKDAKEFKKLKNNLLFSYKEYFDTSEKMAQKFLQELSPSVVLCNGLDAEKEMLKLSGIKLVKSHERMGKSKVTQRLRVYKLNNQLIISFYHLGRHTLNSEEIRFILEQITSLKNDKPLLSCHN